MEIRYGITDNYVRTQAWGAPRALREIIANAMDAVRMSPDAKFTVNFREGSCTLEVRNGGPALEPNMLYIGESGKRDLPPELASTVIGTFGEGLKLALLVLTREKLSAAITSGYWVWRPDFKLDENGVRCFRLRGRHTPGMKHHEGVRIVVSGVSREMYEEAKADILDVGQPAVFSCAFGQILPADTHGGKIYAKNVLLTEDTKLHFGYNVFGDSAILSSRDRTTMTPYEGRVAIWRVLNAWLKSKPKAELVENLLRHVEQNVVEPDRSSWELEFGSGNLLQADSRDVLVDCFYQLYGPNTMPVDNIALRGPRWAALGYKTVYMGRATEAFQLDSRFPPVDTAERQARSKQEHCEPLDATTHPHVARAVEFLQTANPALKVEKVLLVRYALESPTHHGEYDSVKDQYRLSMAYAKSFGEAVIGLAKLLGEVESQFDWSHTTALKLLERALNNLPATAG